MPRPGRTTVTTIGATTLALAILGLGAAGQESTSRDPGGEAAGPYPARVHFGTCAELGDPAAVLVDVGAEHEDAFASLGPQPARPVAVSVTNVPLPLIDPTVATAPYAIVVDDPSDGLLHACGDVAGSIDADAGLAITLVTPEGDIAGVAWLTNVGLEATDVHVFVIAAAGPATEGIGPAPDGSPLPDQSPGPDGSPAPDGSPDPDRDGDGEIDPDPDEIGPQPDVDIDPGEDIDVDV